MLTQSNKLQIQNININKRSRCSSINENHKLKEIYTQRDLENKDQDQDIIIKAQTTVSGVRKKSNQIRQDIILSQNENKNQYPNIQSQIEQINKTNESLSYTLKLNGRYLCEQTSKRRSKSQFTENEFKEVQRNSYKIDESSITIFQQESKQKNNEIILNKSFIKMDPQTEYLYMKRTRTPEKNQISKLQYYADKSYGYNGINSSIQNSMNKTQNYINTVQNSQNQTSAKIIQYYPNNKYNNFNKQSNAMTLYDKRDQIQNNSFNIQNNKTISSNNVNIVQINEHFMKKNTNKQRSYSSNQKQNTIQTCASPHLLDGSQSFKTTLSPFNSQLLNDGNISNNDYSHRRNIQDQQHQKLPIQRVSNFISRNSRVSNISNVTNSLSSNANFKNRRKTLKSGQQLQIEVNDEENSEEEEENPKKVRDEQSLLTKCEKKLNNSIKMLERCLSQAKNVNDILLTNKEKYEKEGNKDMLEFLKSFYKQNNQEDNQKDIQDMSINKSQLNKKQSTFNDNSNLVQKSTGLSINNPEDETLKERNKTGLVVYSTPKKDEENSQSILKKQINDSIKRIEKYLDYSIQVSKQSTIQMEQTQLINPINIKSNEIYLKEESFIHKTINYLQINRQLLTVDIFYSNYQTLPFDLEELEKDDTFLLGEGTFGRVYRVKLYPKHKRYQHITITTHHKSKNKDLISLLADEPEQEDEEYALKIIKCKDMIELERKSAEIIIEYYLQCKQFRHSCKLLLPAYFIQKNEQIEILFLKKLADFNFTKLLNKRREKYLAYTEYELLYIFKELMIQHISLDSNLIY